MFHHSNSPLMCVKLRYQKNNIAQSFALYYRAVVSRTKSVQTALQQPIRKGNKTPCWHLGYSVVDRYILQEGQEHDLHWEILHALHLNDLKKNLLILENILYRLWDTNSYANWSCGCLVMLDIGFASKGRCRKRFLCCDLKVHGVFSKGLSKHLG